MNPRELRMLKALSENPKVSVKELRGLAGALNPAQVKLNLVKKGWDIETAYYPIKDRDGKVCFPGFYLMPPSEQDRARIEIEKAKGAAATTPQAQDVSKKQVSKTSKPNHTKGRENGNSSL